MPCSGCRAVGKEGLWGGALGRRPWSVDSGGWACGRHGNSCRMVDQACSSARSCRGEAGGNSLSSPPWRPEVVPRLAAEPAPPLLPRRRSTLLPLPLPSLLPWLALLLLLPPGCNTCSTAPSIRSSNSMSGLCLLPPEPVWDVAAVHATEGAAAVAAVAEVAAGAVAAAASSWVAATSA